MKTSDSALRALLHGSTTAAFANLVTVTLADSTVARWTTEGFDVVHGGNTYTAVGSGIAPLVQLGRIREAVGLEVSTLEMTLGCGTAGTATIGGTDLRALAVSGGLDDARVAVVRAYMATPGGAVVGTVDRFQGLITDCEADSNEVRARVQSDLYRLEEQLPRHLIREKCSWALGDAGCGVVVASFTGTYSAQNGLLGSPPTAGQFAFNHVSGYSAVDGAGGIITFTSGAQSGISRAVLDWFTVSTTDYVNVSPPFPAAPAAGDTFTWSESCDKTAPRCRDVFSNLTRRRGFDFVPTPDLVVR